MNRLHPFAADALKCGAQQLFATTAGCEDLVAVEVITSGDTITIVAAAAGGPEGVGKVLRGWELNATPAAKEWLPLAAEEHGVRYVEFIII